VPSSSSARRRAAAAALAATAALATGACRLDVNVGVDANADGTGTVKATVTLDEAAAKRAPGLRNQLEVDDLKRAGWRIEGPTKTDDNGQQIVASKRFEDPREAERVVAEISGPEGPFQQFDLRQQRSFLKTKTTFTGTVDLSAGLAHFSDEELTDRLGGQPVGVDVTTLERRLGATIDRLLGVKVSVRLPGEVSSNAPGDTANGASWQPKIGESATLRATSEQWNLGPIALTALAVTAATFSAALLLTNRRRKH
jgi:hypothetical protein